MTGATSACGAAAGATVAGGDDLTVEEIDGVLAAIPRMATVRLTGGEPFARKDFWRIEELARRHLRPSTLVVVTDGVFTDRIVKFCDKRDKSHPVHLEVDLEPARRSSSWTESMQTVRILARYLEQFRLRLTVTQIVRADEDTSHYERLRQRLAPGGVRYRLRTRSADARAVAPSYAVPEGHVRLLPNGDVRACYCGAGRVGNLRHQSFHEVWFSADARSKRDLAERCPGCWGNAAEPGERLASAIA